MVRVVRCERTHPPRARRPPRAVRRRPRARLRRGRRGRRCRRPRAARRPCEPAHAGMGHEPLGLSVDAGRHDDRAGGVHRRRRVAREPLRFRVLDDDGAAGAQRLRGRGAAAHAPDRRAPRPHRLPAPAPGAWRPTAPGACRCGSPRPAPTASSPTSARRREARRSAPTCSCPATSSRAPLPAPAATRERRRLRRAPRRARAARRREAELRFEVSRGGVPVAASQPYLGAARPPRRAARGRPRLPARAPRGARRRRRRDRASRAEYPSAGRYRLFLQFQHGGVRADRGVHRRGGAVSAPRRRSGSSCRSRA